MRESNYSAYPEAISNNLSRIFLVRTSPVNIYLHVLSELNIMNLLSSKIIFDMRFWFVFALCITTSLILIGNLINLDTAIIIGNYVSMPLGLGFVMISIAVLTKFGFGDSIHGLAWIAFVGFSVCWFIGDGMWTLEELFFEEEPYPSIADLFYLIGYPFLLMFLIQYLVPMRTRITKNMILASGIFSVMVLGLILFILWNFDNLNVAFDDIFSVAYPIADIFVLFPSVIGVILFFKGKINFMWSAILFGIILNILGDIGFMYLQLSPNESYHTGHPIDVLFLSAYVFMIFGLYHHIKLFAK